MELWSRGFADGSLEGELRGELSEGGGIGGEEFETKELAAGRSVGGGVDGAPRPLNKKGEQALGVIFESESLPVEFLAVGTIARTGSGAVCFYSGLLEFGGERSNVGAEMGGPADKTWLCEGLQFLGQRIFGVLLQVGRDDFEVAARAEPQEGVLGAAAGMDSAEDGANASTLFDEGDAVLELVATKEDVIEHGRHLVD